MDRTRWPTLSLQRTEALSIFSPDDVDRMFWLFERQLEELRALREEAMRQSEYLREIIARLESLERTQYS